MIEPPSPPERIDLARCDDSRDAVHRAVACLAQGGIVAFATEEIHSLAASALQPESVAKIRATIPEGGPSGLTLLIKGAVEAEDWFPNLSGIGAKLARRGWPGPLTLQFP
ncbi:L-threonylcarbamoyladenylate synthase, partial [Singulisphaera rosea]